MEKYRVESIALRGVGVFDDVRLDFPPIASAERDEEKAEIHLFTGSNGCGKSTLLYALAALFTQPWLPGLVEKRYRNGESRVDFCFAGQSGMYGLKAPTKMKNEFGNFQLILNDVANSKFFGCQIQAYNAELEKTLRTYKETMASFNSQNRNNEISFPFAAFAYSGQRSVIQNASVNAIQEITVSPFENAMSFDATVRPQLLLQWIANNRTKAALAQVEGEQSDARHYDRALERIVTVIRDICEWDIDFKLERD
ncbi:MAG: AAA family ATPase, partial [Smithella sp.]